MVYWLPYSSHTSHHPSQTPCLPWISYATQKLMLDSCKMVKKQSEAFHRFLYHFSKFKTEFYCISFFLTSRLHFWNSPAVTIRFSRVYCNCCCSCSFEAEVIKTGQSSHKMYSNKILNFQESMAILNACTKKSGNLLKTPYIYIYIYIQPKFYNFLYNVQSVVIQYWIKCFNKERDYVEKGIFVV